MRWFFLCISYNELAPTASPESALERVNCDNKNNSNCPALSAGQFGEWSGNLFV